MPRLRQVLSLPQNQCPSLHRESAQLDLSGKKGRARSRRTALLGHNDLACFAAEERGKRRVQIFDGEHVRHELFNDRPISLQNGNVCCEFVVVEVLAAENRKLARQQLGTDILKRKALLTADDHEDTTVSEHINGKLAGNLFSGRIEANIDGGKSPYRLFIAGVHRNSAQLCRKIATPR